MSKRVLFLSHSGSRTGAPIVLLEIVRWLTDNTDTRCSVLFWSGGSLLTEFESLAPCRVLHPAPSESVSLPRQLWHRLSVRPDDTDRHRGRAERAVRGAAQRISAAIDERWMHEWRSCDLVYANSVGSARPLRALRPTSPLLAHVHESGYSLHHTEASGDVAVMIGGHHPIIAASRAVKATLVEDFGVGASRVHVMNSFIKLPPPHVTREAALSLRASLGISRDALIVGGAGTIEWRKGPDIFVQLARRCALLRPQAEIHFVWLGAGSPSEPLERTRIEIDVATSGLSDRVHFLGPHPSPWTFHHMCDVFALTSRAEPLGLVAIEAASLGRPIVCFADAGGMPDFVAGGGGFVVPYLDVEEMATRILSLYDDPGLMASMGQKGAEYIAGRYDAASVVPQIGELILATAR